MAHYNYTIRFYDTVLPAVQSIVDTFAESNSTLIPVGMGGAYDPWLDAQAPAKVGKITVKSILIVDDPDDLQAQIDTYRALYGYGRKHLFKIPHGNDVTIRWTSARLVDIDYEYAPQSASGMMKVEITFQFEAPMPFWFENNNEDWSTSDGFISPGDPGLVTPGGTVRNIITSGSFTLTNNGAVNTYPRFQCTVPTSYTCGSITIKHTAGGYDLETIVYSNGTLSASTTVEMNCRDKTVMQGAAGGYENFTFDSPGWITLFPGNNTIEVTLSAGRLDIEPVWFELYK